MTETIQPQRYDPATLEERGRGRARWFANVVKATDDELRGARILEVGCGFGEFSAALEDVFNAKPIGLDPWPRISQGPYSDRSFHRAVDITGDEALQLGRFDYVASFDVLEHVKDPKAALVNIFALMKPGARAFLKYNLHRGASASHLHAQTQVPWCHLIMSDEEIEQLCFERTGRRRKPAWVNKATYAHYLVWIDEIGFANKRTWYITHEMPDDFYKRYEDILERYPREDLDKNFMCVMLEKSVHSV